VQGQFWELVKPKQSKPPRRILCTVEEADFVQKLGRTRRRSAQERARFLLGKYNEVLAILQTKEDSAPKGKVVSAIAADWYLALKSLGKEKSLTIYQTSIKIYIDAAGDHDVAVFKTSHGLAFLDSLSSRANYRGGQLSVATQRKHIRTVQAMFNWAAKRRLIDRPIYLERPAAVQRDPAAFDLQELTTLKKHLEGKLAATPTHHIQSVEVKTYYRAFILAFFTMLRVGAVWSLSLKQIDLEKRRVLIKSDPELGWNPKKLKETEKPISSGLLEFLADDIAGRSPEERYYLDNGSGSLAVKLPTLSRAFGRLWAEAGIELNGRQPFHGIRKGVLSELAAKGATDVELQDAADHDSIETTRRHYITKKRGTQSALFESIEWSDLDNS